MKTSNKLLLTAYAILLAGVVIVLIKVKSFIHDSVSIHDTKNIELSGEVENKAYDISSFDRLTVEGAVTLNLSKGDTYALTVEADTSLLKYVEVTQEENRLSVRLVNLHKNRIRVYANLTVPEMTLEKITINAGAKIESNNTLTNDNIAIEANAGGHGTFDVQCRELKCDANAGGYATISGSAEKFKGQAAAGGQIKAGDLSVDIAKANASAGGHIQIHVTSEIEANGSAGGTVKYSGNPQIRNTSTSAGGRVISD